MVICEPAEGSRAGRAAWFACSWSTSTAPMAPAVVERTARIIDGRSSLSSRLPAGIRSQIASRCGTLHSYTLFTGYRQQRIRGEMRAFQVLPPQ